MIARTHRTRFAVFGAVALLIAPLTAQERPPRPPDPPPALTPQDTTATAPQDSMRIMPPDSSQRSLPDSLVRYLLPPIPGSLNHRMEWCDVVTDTAMEWLSARTLNQVLASRAGIFGSDPSGAGQYFPLTIRGAAMRSNTVLVDGRPMADPASGIYSLSLFPMEMADRIEVITGPRSFLYGSGGAGGTVNIVTRMESHRIPFSKIRYEEAGYDHAYSDGSFNQDLTRRTNLTMGYQYLGTGWRYYNSGHEQWNIRGALRYHLHPKLSVVISEHYVQTETGLNGGVNYPATGGAASFYPSYAKVYSRYAYEKLTRHDIDLRFIGMLFPDSSDLSTVTFFYSQNLREYRDEEFDGSANVHDDHRSSWFGFNAKQSTTLGMHHVTAGFQFEGRHVEASPTLGSAKNPVAAVWAMDDVALTEGIRIAVYGRSEIFRGEHLNGAGADVALPLGGGLSLHGGASFSRRAPTYPELFWVDSTLTREGAISTERHQVFEAAVHWTAPFGTLRLALAHRTITNPILTAAYDGSGPFPGVRLFNGNRLKTLAAEVTANVRFLDYVLIEGAGTFMIRHDAAGAELEDYPHFWGEGGAYLDGRFLHDNLALKAGVRGRITTRHSGYLLSPPSLIAAPNTIAMLGMGSTLDLVAVAHIGSAYVHVMWENVTDTRFFTSPFMPVMDRTVRFGISWEFLN